MGTAWQRLRRIASDTLLFGLLFPLRCSHCQRRARLQDRDARHQLRRHEFASGGVASDRGAGGVVTGVCVRYRGAVGGEPGTGGGLVASEPVEGVPCNGNAAPTSIVGTTAFGSFGELAPAEFAPGVTVVVLVDGLAVGDFT